MEIVYLRSTLLDWWNKLEDFINFILGRTFYWVGRILFPQRLRKFLEPISNPILDWWDRIDTVLRDWSEKLPEKLSACHETITNLPLKILPLFNRFFDWCSELDVSSIDWKKYVFIVTHLFKRTFSWIRNFFQMAYQKVGMAGIILALFINGLFIGSSIFIYKTAHKIYLTNSARAPASAEEDNRPARPEYYKRDLRQFSIEQVYLPIWVEASFSRKMVVADLNFETSNRSLIVFFTENIPVIRDRISTMVEPTIPDFPLDPEGKRILEDKIVAEINQLLDEHNTDGRVKTIYLTHIISL
jgi:flagellar basal body-associated protein FliL